MFLKIIKDKQPNHLDKCYYKCQNNHLSSQYSIQYNYQNNLQNNHLYSLQHTNCCKFQYNFLYMLFVMHVKTQMVNLIKPLMIIMVVLFLLNF